MNKVIDNNLLSQAFGLYEDELSAKYDESNSFEPSDSFNKKMLKLIKSETSVYHRVTLTRARRVLLVAAIITAVLAASLSVGAIRERIFSFFITSGSEVDYVEYDSDAPISAASVENAMSPSYLPDGYVLKDSRNDRESAYLYYEKGDDYISIQQFTKDGYTSAMDAEFNTTTKENYDGIDFIIKIDDEMTLLIWERDGYVFEAVGFVGTDELLRTAASVK